MRYSSVKDSHTAEAKYRLRNRDGRSSVWGRFFSNKIGHGTTLGHHLRHLGHPPKFYRVQDASSGNNSPFQYHLRIILMKNHWEITKSHVFPKSDFKNKNTLPGCLQTVVRSGDAPKPPFPIKTNKILEKPKKSGSDQPSLWLIWSDQPSLFLSLPKLIPTQFQTEPKPTPDQFQTDPKPKPHRPQTLP